MKRLYKTTRTIMKELTNNPEAKFLSRMAERIRDIKNIISISPVVSLKARNETINEVAISATEMLNNAFLVIFDRAFDMPKDRIIENKTTTTTIVRCDSVSSLYT